jgi:5-methylcytosine-specific restriction endonuclease McrA
MACEVCGRPGPNDAAHIRSKGAGGGDELWNLMTLCRKDHQIQHAMGIESFVEKYGLPIDLDGIYPKRNDRL